LICIAFAGLYCSKTAIAQEDVAFVPDTTVKVHKLMTSEHWLGIRYSYLFTGVQSNVGTKTHMKMTPLNFDLLYTYYRPMWNYLAYFGIQTGVRYLSYGFTTEDEISNYPCTVTAVQIPFYSAFHFDFGKHFRILLNLGLYGGYRISTTKENGWDCFDKRWEYGVGGLAGFAIRAGRFQFVLDGGYHFTLAFLFDPEKFSSASWLYCYPWYANVSFGIHYQIK